MSAPDSGPSSKRLPTTLLSSFGRTSFSASIVSDSLPVCLIERSPIPRSSTSSKPPTSLDSFVLPVGSFFSPSSPWPPVVVDVTCEEGEPPPLPDLEDEVVTDEILPSSYVRFKVPPLMLCTERSPLPTASTTRNPPSELISQWSGLP